MTDTEEVGDLHSLKRHTGGVGGELLREPFRGVSIQAKMLPDEIGRLVLRAEYSHIRREDFMDNESRELEASQAEDRRNRLDLARLVGRPIVVTE